MFNFLVWLKLYYLRFGIIIKTHVRFCFEGSEIKHWLFRTILLSSHCWSTKMYNFERFREKTLIKKKKTYLHIACLSIKLSNFIYGKVGNPSFRLCCRIAYICPLVVDLMPSLNHIFKELHGPHYILILWKTNTQSKHENHTPSQIELANIYSEIRWDKLYTCNDNTCFSAYLEKLLAEKKKCLTGILLMLEFQRLEGTSGDHWVHSCC